jgi:hypothetical protein
VLKGLQGGTVEDSISYHSYGGTLALGRGHKFFTGGVITAQTEKMRISDDGIYMLNSLGIGTAGPTAYLHLKAGTNVASTAPLKFTSGTNLGTAEAGAVEWNGTNLFITQTAGPTRKTIAYTTDIPAAHNSVTLAAIGSSSNANGMTLSTQQLNLEPASASFGGVVTIGTQTFAGDKTFTGAMTVGGYLTKSGGGFTIDHPLDPANKVLTHSFVESPDMKNLYDGVVVLDANGESTIELPEWFEVLNRDFRYQLTPIGRAGMLYVKEEIKNNKFTIGGEPGTKVSWQVTGTRKDAWAEKYRPKIEEEKGSRDGLVKKGEYIAKDCYEKKD